MEKHDSPIELTMNSLMTSLKLQGWSIQSYETEDGKLNVYNRYAGRINKDALEDIKSQFAVDQSEGLPPTYKLELIDRPPEQIIDAVNHSGYHSQHEFIPSDKLISFSFIGEPSLETIEVICQLSELTRPVRRQNILGRFVSKLSNKS